MIARELILIGEITVGAVVALTDRETTTAEITETNTTEMINTMGNAAPRIMNLAVVVEEDPDLDPPLAIVPDPQ